MGNALSGLVGKLFGSREVRILMLGLDAAGKTTILYTLKLKDDKVTTIPTVGFNVETVNMKNVKFNVWDVGGQDKIRPLWRHYYSGRLNRCRGPPAHSDPQIADRCMFSRKQAPKVLFSLSTRLIETVLTRHALSCTVS